ncbi:MAG: hypothetical protein MHMPM18_001098 [Marteilia pararefringens]
MINLLNGIKKDDIIEGLDFVFKICQGTNETFISNELRCVKVTWLNVARLYDNIRAPVIKPVKVFKIVRLFELLELPPIVPSD